MPAKVDELDELKHTTKLPILIGSGVTTSNLLNYIAVDALIVGSHFKEGGLWSNDLDNERVQEFMKKRNSLL